MGNSDKSTVLASIYQHLLEKANERWLRMDAWQTAFVADLFSVDDKASHQAGNGKCL